LERFWDDLARNDIVLKSPDWPEEILKDREQAMSSRRVKVSDWEGLKTGSEGMFHTGRNYKPC